MLNPNSVSNKGAKHEARKLAKQLARAKVVKPLPPRQQRFVEEMAGDAPSAAEAARRAGYSDAGEGAKVEACRLLTKPNVVSAIEKARERQQRRAMMTREASQARLQAMADQALALGQVAAAVRAEELAGRMAGLYVERNETVQMNIELERLNAGDLQQLMGEVAKRLMQLASNGQSTPDISQGNQQDSPSAEVMPPELGKP